MLNLDQFHVELLVFIFSTKALLTARLLRRIEALLALRSFAIKRDFSAPPTIWKTRLPYFNTLSCESNTA